MTPDSPPGSAYPLPCRRGPRQSRPRPRDRARRPCGPGTDRPGWSDGSSSSCVRLYFGRARQPRCHLALAILEQPAIRMDPIRTGSDRSPAKRDIVMLTDREDRTPSRVGGGDRLDAVISAGRQVDDDPVDVWQGRLERRLGPEPLRLAAGSTDEIGKSGGPDQVVGEDGDAGD